MYFRAKKSNPFATKTIEFNDKKKYIFDIILIK